MALSATTVFEMRSGGSDTNGGGYVSTGTDYSQQNSPQLSVSDGACTGDTTLTSATGGFTTAMIGNLLYLSSGTERYQITARADTNTVTIDRNGPNATGMTVNVGGALASPGEFGRIQNAHAVNGFKCWIKADGTYTLTSSSANVAGGRVAGASGRHFQMEGYTTTRGDNGQATISCGAIGTITVLAATGSATPVSYHIFFRSLKVDANGQSSIVAFSLTGQLAMALNCHALSCATGFSLASNRVIRCYAESCTTGFGGTTPQVFLSRAKGCTTGFSVGAATALVHGCLATGGTTGFTSGGDYQTFVNCTAYGCSGDGFDAGFSMAAINCHAEGCGGFGYDGARQTLINCGSYNNTSGRSDTGDVFQDIGAITLSGSAFENAAGDDFRLNATASAGALLRAAALQLYPVGSTVGYLDVGPVQHADPAAGGGGVPIIGGNIIRVHTV